MPFEKFEVKGLLLMRQRTTDSYCSNEHLAAISNKTATTNCYSIIVFSQ